MQGANLRKRIIYTILGLLSLIPIGIGACFVSIHFECSGIATDCPHKEQLLYNPTVWGYFCMFAGISLFLLSMLLERRADKREKISGNTKDGYEIPSVYNSDQTAYELLEMIENDKKRRK